MHSYCANNFLNLEDVLIKNVIQADSFVKVLIETGLKFFRLSAMHCETAIHLDH